MDRDAVLAAVDKRIRSLPGVVEVRYLDDNIKQQIVHYEKVAESHGAAGGLMSYKNRGVWEVLSRQVSLVIVGDQNFIMDTDLHGVVSMVDQAGQVLGEYVPPGKREEKLKENPNAFFMSDDFIMYRDRTPVGEPYFLLDEIPIHDLDDIDGITRVTSGSLTTLSDDIVRGLLNCSGQKRWTTMIGFDLKE
jgi:hypothetical protein